jgi:hypothetical protein
MSNLMPEGWNKTLDDLAKEIEEGQLLGIFGDEIEWAREYERSQLPRSTVFPKPDEVWETVDECEVQYMEMFTAPASGGGQTRLSAGEKVKMIGLADAKPIRVSFIPLRYEELHARIVPKATRREPRYGGYCLSAKTAYFNQHFRLVERATRSKNPRPR